MVDVNRGLRNQIPNDWAFDPALGPFVRQIIEQVENLRDRTGGDTDYIVQLYTDAMVALAQLATAADKGIYSDAAGSFAEFDLPSYFRSFSAAATAEAGAHAYLNLEIGTDVQAYSSVLNAAAQGTYIPTLTDVTNIDATGAYTLQYVRLGNVVTVSGRVDANPTAGSGTTTNFRMSLPIASNFSNTTQLGGTACSQGGETIAISSDSTNDEADFTWSTNNTATTGYWFTFAYQVI